MGVIKKIFYRGTILDKPSFRNFFLDMEENIHIHYRDLRIELSRGEFEDICSIFRKQSSELQAIIDEKNYQDGKLANANQEDVRIWTESRLNHELKYHPQRLSIEACSDGYHLHFRNIKLLMNDNEFRQLVKIFSEIDVDSPVAESYEEVLSLIELNDVDFVLDSGNVPGQLLALAVAKYHLPKVRDIFGQIGFTSDPQPGAVHYNGASLKVVVREDKGKTPMDYKRLRGLEKTERLIPYLTRKGEAIDPNELNNIKCQVLDMLAAMEKEQPTYVMADLYSWLYSPSLQQVIFPYSHQPISGKKMVAPLSKAWNDLLVALKLWFVKPDKRTFARPRQEELSQAVHKIIEEQVATCPAVTRVYLMGSALRGDMGLYRVPFVNGPLVKLGSDVDILIEMDPTCENDVASSWHFIKQQASNFCAIYHIDQIPLADGVEEWAKAFPNLNLIQHLIDAYVFFPSRGHAEEKDAFLKKFNAKLVYERDKELPEEERIARVIRHRYGLADAQVEKMKVSTENALYQVTGAGYDPILKIFKVAGNYHRSEVAVHTAYEETLIQQLRQRGVSTAGILPPLTGGQVEVEGFPALLFEKIVGEVQSRPEYPMQTIAAALAHIHQVQLQNPIDLQVPFSFDHFCNIWLPCFATFRTNEALDEPLKKLFDGLSPMVDGFLIPEKRLELLQSSPMLHNHGDVKPKNVIMDSQGRAHWFDFNNAYFGPRMADVINGAIEFSLAEKYIHLADFNRFDAFINHYHGASPLFGQERDTLLTWLQLLGIIFFVKEVRVFLQRPQEELRRKRAIAIGEFVVARSA